MQRVKSQRDLFLFSFYFVIHEVDVFLDPTCADIVCQNRGSCEEVNDIPRCNCQERYTGTYCENGE